VPHGATSHKISFGRVSPFWAQLSASNFLSLSPWIICNENRKVQRRHGWSHIVQLHFYTLGPSCSKRAGCSTCNRGVKSQISRLERLQFFILLLLKLFTDRRMEEIYPQEYPELAAGKAIKSQVRVVSSSALKFNDVNWLSHRLWTDQRLAAATSLLTVPHGFGIRRNRSEWHHPNVFRWFRWLKRMTSSCV